MSIKAHPKEIRTAVGGGWPFITMLSMVIALFWFFYCLFNWTWSWWLLIFVGLFILVSHRYGTLLNEEEKRVQAKEADRETVA